MKSPPLVLFISLFTRLMIKTLLGSGKSFLFESEDDSASSSGNSIKGGGNKLDVLGKLMETAKNYIGDTFPKTALVLGTLRDVVKLDMYVVLCGLLMGLVIPLVKEDFVLGGWCLGGLLGVGVGNGLDGGERGTGISEGVGGEGRSVMGEGEL